MYWAPLVLLVIPLLLLSCTTRSNAEPFVAGLNQPRGMVFDDTGNLFVAEAGYREAAVDGKKPADTNHSGRILRITSAGEMTVVVDDLPFTYYEGTGDVGPTDVVIRDDALYVLTGEGYDDQLSRMVLRVLPGGSLEPVASILNFAIGISSSVDQQIGSFASNPYAMIADGDGSTLLVTDAASGLVLRVSLNGRIRTFAEFPNMHPLAGMAYGPDGRVYIAMFSVRPHTPDSGEIWAADSSGELVLVSQDLTMPIDVAFDAAGLMYVLEFGSSRKPDRLYTSGDGRLLRIGPDGAREVVLDRLDYPTALAFSPAGDLYVAVGGAFTEQGGGTILRVPCGRLSTVEVCAR